VAYSPDGTKVLTGAENPDNTSRLWDAATGAHIRSFTGHSYHVRSVAFSPDGTKVLTGSWDQKAMLWDAGPEQTLTISSRPIAGISITGTRPGTTGYTAACYNQEAVTLGPVSAAIFSGGNFYNFLYWLIDGQPQPHGQTTVQITMDASHAAEARYNLFADVNGDCVVNVLDLIIVRNGLGKNTATGDNWKADVNQDGVVNVMDLIRVRNELGARCGN